MPRKIKKAKIAIKSHLKSKRSKRKAQAVKPKSEKIIGKSLPKPLFISKVQVQAVKPVSAFSGVPLQTPHPQNTSGLPFSYNVTKLVLMARDPHWVFCYWDFSAETWKWIQEIYRSHPGSVHAILRIYEVSDVKFNGLNANHFFDMDVSLETKNWYVHVNGANREWIFDLALVDAAGKFYLVARSNRVKTPRDRPSDVVDEDWMIEGFDEIYALSGGFGRGLSSGEIKKRVQSRYLFDRVSSSSHVKQFK